MKNHVNEAEVYGYVLDRLADDTKKELDRHMSNCEPCRKRVTYTLNRLGRNEECSKVRSLFSGFKEESIAAVEMRRVRDHKMVCDGCEKAFRVFLQKKQGEQSSKRVQRLPDAAHLAGTLFSEFIIKTSSHYRDALLKEKKQEVKKSEKPASRKKAGSLPAQTSHRRKKST